MSDDKPVPVDGPTGEAATWLDDFTYETFDAADIDGIDTDDGEATVISEVGESDRYIASTLEATEYIGSRV